MSTDVLEASKGLAQIGIENHMIPFILASRDLLSIESEVEGQFQLRLDRKAWDDGSKYKLLIRVSPPPMFNDAIAEVMTIAERYDMIVSTTDNGLALEFAF